MSSVQYEYLVRRKRDGELFVALGNFKAGWNRPKYLYQFVGENYPYGVFTPWGKRKNISVDGISLEDGPVSKTASKYPPVPAY